MANAELKTQKNSASVDAFLASVSDEGRRKDAQKTCQIMQEITGDKPIMWGSSIVGFGSYYYKYASGREANWMRVGFSPRKASLTLYLMDGFDNHEQLLSKLGPHSTAKSCLYIKKLEDVDENILRKLIKASYNSKAMGEQVQGLV